MKHLMTTVLLLALAASPALAQSSEPAAPPSPVVADAARTNALANAVQARTPEEQANQSGFQISVELDHALGIGTFVDPQIYAALVGTLAVQPAYLFSVGRQKLVLTGTFRMAYEYTMPDNETGRGVRVFDTRFGLSAPRLYREPVTGIGFTPSVGLTVPTSLESWKATLITNVSLGLSATRSLGPVDLRASVGGSRGFYASPLNATPASDARDSQGNLVFIQRGSEPFVNQSGWNPAWGFNVGGSVQWRASGSLLVYAGYTFSKGWNYPATLVHDEYSPKGVDANGDLVGKDGFVAKDRVTAVLGISYQLNEHYSLDLGLGNVQTPFSSKGEYHFPWFAFTTLADNTTQISVTLAAAY